jgi:hypothetical protein
MDEELEMEAKTKEIIKSKKELSFSEAFKQGEVLSEFERKYSCKLYNKNKKK